MDASNDLFLSYRWADKPAVEPLLATLRARGVRVWQDAREVDDFASIQQSVGNGLAGSRALLAWYSIRYNESRACQWELTAAYCAAQAEGDPRRRILVVNPEAGNAHVHLPELFDQLHLSGQQLQGDQGAADALADRIVTALRDTVPANPLGELRALTPPPWLPSMGTGSTRFVGRLRQMWEMHAKLLANRAAMLTGTGGKPGVAVVRGTGGIGKSLLAEEYALRFGAAYPGGVYWIRAYGHPDGGTVIDTKQRAVMREAQLVDLAMGLGIDTGGMVAEQVRAAMSQHYERGGLPFLWVVDDLPSDLDADTLGDWLAPHALGRTLFTSRTRRFAHLPTLDLPQLEPDEARGLLTRQVPLTAADTQLADQICAALGFHALAVDITAALVARRGLDGTLKALERQDRDVLDLAAQFDETLPNGHQRHIAATFLASIGQLDDAARDLLRLATVLAAAPIPRLLMVRGLGATANLSEDDAQDRADLAVDQLLSSSLADDAGEGAINVHTLVSRTMRFADGSAHAVATWRDLAVRLVAREMAQGADIRRHRDLERWVVHARELSGEGDDAGIAKLLGNVARYDSERAAYSLAQRGYEQERDIRSRIQGDDHPDTLRSMNNLALTLQNQGDLAGARRLQEAVLEVVLRVLGDEHPDALTLMNNLASTIKRQGDLPGAKRLEERVLEVRKRVQGDEHPNTLTSMNNLADTIKSQGDLAGARRLQETVLGVIRRVLGDEHPNTLTAMNNLASTLWGQGNLHGAQQLEEKVLDARMRVLGDEHPDTLTSMNNLASTLKSQDDLLGARRLQEAALQIRKRVLGDEHPDTLTSMNNLASTLKSQGDLPCARQLLETVLEISKRVLGDEHPYTLMSMNNLAITLWDQGESDLARRLQAICVAGLARSLGPTHPTSSDAADALRTMEGAS